MSFLFCSGYAHQLTSSGGGNEGHGPQRAALVSGGGGEDRAQEHGDEEAGVPGSPLPFKKRFAEVLRNSHETSPSYVELQEGVLMNTSQPQTPDAPQKHASTGSQTAGDGPQGASFTKPSSPSANGIGAQGAGRARPVQVVAQPTGGVKASVKMEDLMPHLFQPLALEPPSPTGISGRIVVTSKPSANLLTSEGGLGSEYQHPLHRSNASFSSPRSGNLQAERQHLKSLDKDKLSSIRFIRRPTDPEEDQNRGDRKKESNRSNAVKGAGAGGPPDQPPNWSSTGNAADLNVPENATEQVILAELVFKGVGTAGLVTPFVLCFLREELLECIETPATFHTMDAEVDRYCGRLKWSKFKYPNNPTQTACRKHAKHVVIQLRRVLNTCKQSRYNCLRELWLSTLLPGVTKLSSVMGIPQVNDLNSLSQYISRAVTSADPPEVWKHPELESNSCVFAHGLQETVQKQAKTKPKKGSKNDKDSKTKETKNMVLSLRLLLLLLQNQLVEPTMIGFLLSLLDMGNCKNILKKDPPYKVSEKLTVSSKGLFQATFANLISEAFVVDLRECATGATAYLGSRASVLCPNLVALAKLRATLPLILHAVAQSNWEGAKTKASSFERDFEASQVHVKDLEEIQASVKVYAVMCVSLNFALTSWKGSAARWVVRQKLLSRLLKKTLGEVTASIFSDQEAAKEFAFAVRSAERHSSAEPEALLKHESMRVAALELDARFFCQTGLPGLGKTVSGALKVAVKSLARIKKKKNRRKERKGLSSTSSISFLERLSPRRSEGQAVVPFQRKAKRTDDNTFVPSSFLFSPPSTTPGYQGTVTAVLGSATGMTLKSALKRIDLKQSRTILQDSKFLKQSWWKILAKIFFRLKAGEQGIVLFGALMWISLFIISIPFSILPGLGVEAIAAFCIISLVLVILDLIQRQSAFHIFNANRNE
ncbi:hypothetical protein Esti_001087 [Eimeria stiedai]